MLAAEQLDAVYRDLERPLMPVLAAIERAGVRIDGAALAAQSQHVERELARAERRRSSSSPARRSTSTRRSSCREILFDKLQLPALKRNGKTRTASTAVEVLEELALAHDLPRLILEWRALQKLKGTYIDALPQLVNPETGRVHTCFNQAVAATGRLSSSDPNLQNIPIRTELGREIRRAFIAEPGHVLISADYSQIEFRVLAHLAERSGARRRVPRGRRHPRADRAEDLRRRQRPRPARAAQHREDGQLRAALRQDARSRWPRTSASRSRRRRSSSTPTSPASRACAPSSIARSRRRARPASCKTMFGRRRLVPELNSRNGQIRSAAERVAVNMPIQGTAADILKRAMIDVHAALAPLPRRAHDPDRPRRTAVRGARRRRPRTIAAVVRERMQDARVAERAADRRRRDRRELEGREVVGASRTFAERVPSIA